MTIDAATRLEVLDWGGRGDPLLLLAGMGNSAHVFDDFALKLVDRFHVLGVTRRGTGASTHPDGGYDIGTLTRDLHEVVDRLKLGRVDLVGHSLGGEEITLFASRYPDRVLKVVYLDAAYDRVGYAPAIPPPPAATANDLASPSAFRAYRARIISLQPEAEIRATVSFDTEGRATTNSTPPAVWAAIEKSLTHPAYSQVQALALAIYATPSGPADLAPSYALATPENQARLDQLFEDHRTWAAEQRQRFATEVPRGRVVEIVGAPHYVFITHEAQVLREMRAFLLNRKE